MIVRRWGLARLIKTGNETDGYEVYPSIDVAIRSGAVKGAYSSVCDLAERFAVCKVAWDDVASPGGFPESNDFRLIPNILLDDDLTVASPVLNGQVLIQPLAYLESIATTVQLISVPISVAIGA